MMQVSVTQVALLSRIGELTLQFLANLIIPDHNAGVFISPRERSSIKPGDWLIESLFGGLRRWDAQYFLHIAEHGYTYENTLAFFPLYPMCLKMLSHLVQQLMPIFSFRAIALLVAVSLNVFFFVRASAALYDLSLLVLKDRAKAKVAVILFCFNPASIFFTAPYSESLFAWATFTIMKQSMQKISLLLNFPLTLAVVCRSNGIINFGFILYYGLRKIIMYRSFKMTVKILLCAGAVIAVTLFHFSLTQGYNYRLFCLKANINHPKFIVNYAKKNNYVLAGNKTEHTSPWCHNPIPMAYSYIQNEYWNVGFLNYYELKQLPNFLLAFPMIYFVFRNSLNYLRRQKYYAYRLGLFISNTKRLHLTHYDAEIFVYIVHGIFLTLFGLLFMHIQVITRMMASASPLIYWFGASKFCYVKTMRPDEMKTQLNTNQIKIDAKSKRKLLACAHLSSETDWIGIEFFRDIFIEDNWNVRLLIAWFLGYTIIGTILFSNFLPWT